MRPLRLFVRIFIAALAVLSATGNLRAQYSISTVAGGGPNNLNALEASIGYPESIAFDAAGNAYVAESFAHQVLKISTAGMVTVVAGNGTAGYSGDGGAATGATLGDYGPQGVFVDSSGNIFIADTGNSVVREVSAGTGNIQTVAGVEYDSGDGNACQSGGDGGPALSAHLCLPYGVVVDAAGDLFIADFGNSAVREVVEGTGNMQTVAGTLGTPGFVDGVTATKAELDLPGGVALDAAGNIVIADTFNSVIRVVNPGTQSVTVAGTTIPAGFIQTIAGTQYDSYDGSACNKTTGDGGPAASGSLCLPFGVFVDSAENVLVADYGNLAVREVSAAGTISTVAGTLGSACQVYPVGISCGEGGPATSALLNYPTGVYEDSAGDIFIADTEDETVREVAASTSDIQAFAGNGFQAWSGDGGLPTNAELNDPGAVFVDAAGDLFIADTSNSVVREVVFSTGDIQTVAGNGVPGYSLDGVSPTATELNYPSGVFVDAAGDIFIADTANSAIREVVALTGLIQTVAGTPGIAGYNGDGIAATTAELSSPSAVFVDGAGDIFIADSGNSAIREVVAGTGKIQTVAGTPGETCDDDTKTTMCGDSGPATSAYLNFPGSVYLDAAGDIFIADTFDDVIREVMATTGNIQTVAGTLGQRNFSGDGGLATSAALDHPSGVFIDAANDILIADSDNAAIREVVATTGLIETIAGTPPNAGFSGDNGIATSAALNFPAGIYVTGAGQIFVADTGNSRIRQLAPPPITVAVAPSTATVVVNALQQFSATVTGNADTSVSWYVNGAAGGNATVGTITSTGLFTAPAAVPSPATVTITAVSLADNTVSATAQATIANPSTTVTVAVSANPATTQVYTGTTQPFTATVAGTTNSAVTWYVEGELGGNATFGTIDTSGNYTAPASVPSPATVVIEAVSQADATAIGTDSITIVLAPSAPPPPAQSVSAGGTANYSLALSADADTAGQAITLSCLQSSLPAGATCAFTPATVTPSSTSTVPFTLAVSVPANSASFERSNARVYLAFIPLAGLLLLGVRRRVRSQSRIWLGYLFVSVLLMGLAACGGSGGVGGGTSPSAPVTYTIKIQGATKAHPNPFTITTVSLTVN